MARSTVEAIVKAHRHEPQLVKSADHHPHTGLNLRLATVITKWVGTMWAAYLFAALALVALPQAIETGSVTVLVNWLSSNFIQLVLLPIIIVGQNIQSKASDARAEADHATLVALQTLNATQLNILEQLRARSAQPTAPAYPFDAKHAAQSKAGGA